MSDPTPITPETPETPTPEAPEDVTGLKSALEKERADRKQFEKDFKAAQKRITDFENKDKSETERLTSERDALKTQAETALQKLQLANARSAVTEAATKANAVSPRAVFALIREDIEFDDDGEPTNVTALLKAAQSDEPSLFRKSSGKGDGGEGGGTVEANSVNQMNDFIRAQARRVGR